MLPEYPRHHISPAFTRLRFFFFSVFERKIHLIDHTCIGFFLFNNNKNSMLIEEWKSEWAYFRMQKVCKRIFRALGFTSFDLRQTISLSHKLSHMSNEIFTSFLGKNFGTGHRPHLCFFFSLAVVHQFGSNRIL